MATSTNSLFSTAVISGSSSAPNLHQINSTSPSGTNLLSTHLPIKMKYGQENVLNMERFFANNLKSKNTHSVLMHLLDFVVGQSPFFWREISILVFGFSQSTHMSCTNVCVI